MRYHRISALFVVIIFPLGGFTTPLSPWDDMHTMHSWNAVPSNWESLGFSLAETTVDLHVALKPHRENALVDALYEVSDPMHRKYGAHLSKEQVAELVAPHPDTLGLVHSWLGYHSVPSSSVSVSHGGSSLKLVGVPVPQANNLLGASYQLYRHVETNETVLRTVGYSLPAALHAHVQTVAPTTYFPSPRTRWQAPRKHSDRVATGLAKVTSREPVVVLSNRDESEDTTPSFLRWAYNTWGYTPSATHLNVLGIVGFVEHYPSPADLKTYMDKYSLGSDAVLIVEKVNGGGYDPEKPHVEANLDTQFAEAMAYPTPLIFYSTGHGPLGMDDAYLSSLDYILEQSSVPQTISVSYGNEEKDYPRDYALYVCYLFAQLGARGVSVLFASGDHGVGNGDCKAGDGLNNVRFVPMFPATCPWVTSVGGTTGYFPEVAARLSGGGFSNYFTRPSYQQQAVSTFLQDLGDLHRGLYNYSGRAIPDISAQAMNFPIIFKGVDEMVSGTSGSTPIVAGIISLLNDFLLSEGKAPLGFLNPWLYGRAQSGLNDIASGSNPGCNTDGFPAITGWDPVTGLGTPDFERLQQRLYLIPMS